MGFSSANLSSSGSNVHLFGPHRVLPGRLSVTRTFGDVEAKHPRLGGNPKVVVAVPDVREFDISDSHDFVLLASDGIFDKLSTKEVVESIWHSANQKQSEFGNVHEFCGTAVDTVFRFSFARKTTDNITVVVIGFDNLKRQLFSGKKNNRQSSSPATTTSNPSNPSISPLKLTAKENSFQQSSKDAVKPYDFNLSQSKRPTQISSGFSSPHYKVRETDRKEASSYSDKPLPFQSEVRRSILPTDSAGSPQQFHFKYNLQYLSTNHPEYSTLDSRLHYNSYSKQKALN